MVKKSKPKSKAKPPVATVAYYGSYYRTATKVAVGLIKNGERSQQSLGTGGSRM